jgi:hypothetical protein
MGRHHFHLIANAVVSNLKRNLSSVKKKKAEGKH